MCTNSKYQNLKDQFREIDCCESLIKLLLSGKPKRKVKASPLEQLVFDFVVEVNECRSQNIYRKVKVKEYDRSWPERGDSAKNGNLLHVIHTCLALPKEQLPNGARLMEVIEIRRRGGDPAGIPFIHQLDIYTNSKPDGKEG